MYISVRDGQIQNYQNPLDCISSGQLIKLGVYSMFCWRDDEAGAVAPVLMWYCILEDVDEICPVATALSQFEAYFWQTNDSLGDVVKLWPSSNGPAHYQAPLCSSALGSLSRDIEQLTRRSDFCHTESQA